MLLPHEALSEEVISDPGVIESFEEAKRAGDLPPIYSNHPRTISATASGHKILPFALYVDGVQYTRRDTVIAFVAYFLHSNR